MVAVGWWQSGGGKERWDGTIGSPGIYPRVESGVWLETLDLHVPSEWYLNDLRVLTSMFTRSTSLGEANEVHNKSIQANIKQQKYPSTANPKM